MPRSAVLPVALLLVLLLVAASTGTATSSGVIRSCASSTGSVALFNLSAAVANASPNDYYETVQLVAALGGIVNRNTSQLFVFLTPADTQWWPYVQQQV